MHEINFKKKILLVIFPVVMITGFSLLGHFWQKETKQSAREEKGAQASVKEAIGSETFAIDEANSGELDGSDRVYRDPQGVFSLRYPKEFSIQEFFDEEKEIVIMGGSNRQGFQIVRSPFDEPAPLTPKRILEDLDILPQNPRDIEIDGALALSFYGYEEGFADTYEVWFIYGGYLYQITTYKEFEEKLREILGTWRFD